MARIWMDIQDNELRVLAEELNQRFRDGAVETFFTSLVRPYFQSRFAQAFKANGRMTRWPPLAVRTRVDKLGMGAPIGATLVRTGDLRSQVTSFKGQYASGTFQIPAEGEIFPKFVGHQLGAPHGGAVPNLPRRPMVEIATEDPGAILRLAKEYFLRGFRR